MARGFPLKGEFLTGLYKEKGHPPVLVVELAREEQFQFLCSVVNEEMFLRVRRTAAKYRQVVVNTLDREEVDPGVYDYDNCRLNTTIKVTEPNQSKRQKLDNAPFWSMLFVHSREKFKNKDKLAIAIEKDSGEILMRCLVEAKK